MGMRLWNKTRDGINWDRGVGIDKEREVSRIGSGSGVEDTIMGLERSDDFLRRTGPNPDGGRPSE